MTTLTAWHHRVSSQTVKLSLWRQFLGAVGAGQVDKQASVEYYNGLFVYEAVSRGLEEYHRTKLSVTRRIYAITPS